MLPPVECAPLLVAGRRMWWEWQGILQGPQSGRCGMEKKGHSMVTSLTLPFQWNETRHLSPAQKWYVGAHGKVHTCVLEHDHSKSNWGSERLCRYPKHAVCTTKHQGLDSSCSGSTNMKQCQHLTPKLRCCSHTALSSKNHLNTRELCVLCQRHF